MKKLLGLVAVVFVAALGSSPLSGQSASLVVYGDVVSTLTLSQAKGVSDDLLAAVGRPPGVERAYVTGAASIQRELDPIFNEDLIKGERIAIPIALLVLLAVFGISASVTIPFIFAACTITARSGSSTASRTSPRRRPT